MGILVGAFPCGVITVFEELYGSESLTQVYAIMIEYLAGLPKHAREKIIEICYDDACHFKKFSEDEKRSERNEITKYMATLGKHVDKFHFPNHVDKWCHQNCNPQDVKHLDGVNTPICEQLFSAINKFTNAKAMNEAHFFLFFLYIFDLHNLNIEGKLRSVANPISEYRYDLIKSLDKEVEPIDDVSVLMANLVVDNHKEDFEKTVGENVANAEKSEAADKETITEFPCKLCDAKYKRVGNLKLHIKNKHQENNFQTEPSLNLCKVCGRTFVSKGDLQNHMPLHNKCLVCDIPFEDVKYLNRHNKVHHSPVTCTICDKECSDKETYTEHVKEHLKCDICGKEFDKQHKINRHIKTHK